MKRGFTLLEVLVATVLMAVAVTGLLSSLSTSLRNASRLTDYDRAAMLARRKMDELSLAPQFPKHQVMQGLFDPAITGGVESGWRARLTTFEQPPTTAPGTPVLDRLELEIWWMAGSQRRTFLLESYRTSVLRPEDIAAQ